MKKIIRLTESDLTRIVKRVVKEVVTEDTTSEPIRKLTKDDIAPNFQFLDSKLKNILQKWEVQGDNQIHIYTKPHNFDYKGTHIVFFFNPNTIKINKATNYSEDVKADKGTGGYIQITIKDLHLKAFENANKVGLTTIKTINTQGGVISVYLHLDPKSSMYLGSEL